MGRSPPPDGRRGAATAPTAGWRPPVAAPTRGAADSTLHAAFTKTSAHGGVDARNAAGVRRRRAVSPRLRTREPERQRRPRAPLDPGDAVAVLRPARERDEAPSSR